MSDLARDPWASRRVAGRFVNLHDETDKTLAEVAAWRRQGGAVPWPAWIDDPPQRPPLPPAPGRIAATYIGHASWLLQLGGRVVLLDPVWSARVSPIPFLGPLRVRAPGQRLENLPKPDLLLVSHNHYDHMDRPTLRRIRRLWNPPALTPLGNARHLAKAGIAARELDWWEGETVAGLRVTCLPAQHFSARTPWDRRVALWGGFAIEADGARVVFAGDSGWWGGFAEIGRRVPAPDLALLPIGAYAPRWFMRTQHMDPDEAVAAHLALGARRSLAMHFGTFAGLTDEAIDEPAARLAAARDAAGLPPEAFEVPAFGKTYEVAAGQAAA